MINHILIAYGNQLGYQHGAKYQILRLISQFGLSGRRITVVTDKPKLFDQYPVQLLHLDAAKVTQWGGEGTDHFGIKLKGFKWAASQHQLDFNLLLDTDMYWTKDPAQLAQKIRPGEAAIYRDEGPIIGSRNRSIRRFEESLAGQDICWLGGSSYHLTQNSRMYGSAIIGLHGSELALVENAFHLFRALSPYVEAHTVEQFALSESLRLNNIDTFEGKSFTNNWSSIGKKNYATPVLARFFEEEGEHNFPAHLEKWKCIPIRRPAYEILKQKIERWKRKG